MGFSSSDLDPFMTEIEDYIQAVIERKLGINEGEAELTAGTNTITFNTPYDSGEDWEFIKMKAVDADGFNIGVTIGTMSNTGFEVVVSSPCTFKYRTSYIRNWISD
jgi:hypothetical protein